MTLRPYLLALPLVAFGCAESAPAKVSAPPQAPQTPVAVVDLSPPPPPSAKPVDKPADKPAEDAVDQKEAEDAARQYGMIGLLSAGAGGDPDAPTAPWGQDDVLGNDPLAAQGNMWGAAVGDSFGAGGLGLAGAGAGGTGEGIGLGSIGTLGHGAGTGTGQGFGSGSGRLGGSRRTKPPTVKVGATSVSGRLPPEVIRRIVRQNFGRFRLCYENGLRKTPTLHGKVSVRFVIGKDGSTTSASDAGSDLPNKEVVSCVVRSFKDLSYPQPEGGIVSVVYPIQFDPGEDAAPATPPPAAPAAAPKAPPPPAPPPPAAQP